MNNNLNTREKLIEQLNKLISLTEESELNNNDSIDLKKLNDYALLNLINNEIIQLRKDYNSLSELKNKFSNELQEIGKEITKKAQQKQDEVRNKLSEIEEKKVKDLEENIYKTFRKHFNTRLKDLLMHQTSKELNEEYKDVILNVLNHTVGNVALEKINSLEEEIKKLNQKIKKLENSQKKQIEKNDNTNLENTTMIEASQKHDKETKQEVKK